MNKTSTARSTPGASSRTALTGLELLVLALFFLSGAAALIYEVVWQRELTYVFGGSAFAIATVLAAYMAGLALGSTAFGRRIDRRGHPLVVYGLLEAGIAVWAILLPYLLGGLDSVYAAIYRGLEPGPMALNLIRFVLCFLLLLVPTTLMGGTLPVLGKLLITNWKGLGTRAGLIYGINTLGAVLGVAAGGFIILPALGLRGGTFLAVFVNLAVAGAAIVTARFVPYRAAATVDASSPTPAKSDTHYSPGLRRAVLVVYAASGFAALSYEVSWVKVLSMILGTTTYAFTTMLTTFLLGLALGAFLFGKLADKYGKPEALLVLVQLAITVLCLGTIPLLERLPQAFVDNFTAWSTGWARIELLKFFLAASVMFLPTLLMGGTFPLVTRVYVDRAQMGKSLGSLYASNTVGAILGSFLTGFVIVPLVGRQNAILIASFVNVAAALFLVLVLHWKGVPGGLRIGAAILGLLLIPAWILGLQKWDPRIMSSGAYYYPKLMAAKGSILEYLDESKLLFYRESTEATISVWQSQYITTLRINGKIDASSHGDMATQKLVSHLPALYHGGKDLDAAVIGLASGISVGSLLTHPVRQVDVIELVHGVEDAARHFAPYNQDCLDDPRFNLIINDGRNQLKLSEKKYDLLVSQPTNPWIAGVGALFTEEFFELTKERLKPGGVVCVWVQLYHMRDVDAKAMLSTFLDAYPYAHLWTGYAGDLIIVASESPLKLDVANLDRLLDGPVGADFANLEILPVPNLLSYFITDRAGMEDYVAGNEQRVTDDNLYLEYAVPRHMFDEGDQINLLALEPFWKSAETIITNAPADSAFIPEVRDYKQAHLMSLRGFFGSPLPNGIASREDAYRWALARAPRELVARTQLANYLNESGIQQLQQGNTAAAEKLFQEALDQGNRAERSLAANNLGYIRYQQGNMDAARELWKRSATEEPFSPVVNYNLALLASNSEDFGEAARYLEIAVAYDPGNASILNNLAYALLEEGRDLAQAESRAREALSVEQSPEYLDTLGSVLLKREKWTEALGVLDQLMKEKPGDLAVVLAHARALAGAGHPDRARAETERVIEEARDDDLRRQAREFLDSL